MSRVPSATDEIVTYRECVQTLERLGDPLFVVDRDLKILSVNRAFRDWLHDFDVDIPLIGVHLFEAFSVIPSHMLDEYRQVFESGEIQVTSEVTSLNEHKIFTEIRKIPVFANGNVDRVVTIIHDVTEQRMLERKFEDYKTTSEERFSSIFNESPVSICVFDRDGILTHANPACATLFGLASSNDLLGCDLFRTPDVPIEIMEKIRRGERIDFDWILDLDALSGKYETTKSGVMHIGVLVSPIHSSQQINGWIVQMQDITQWRLAHLRMEKVRDIALEYLDLMTHDISNYLQSLLMCSGLLSEVAKDGGKGHIISMMDEAIFDCIEMIKQARKSTLELDEP
jgi:PAS domain S-box-containing protein